MKKKKMSLASKINLIRAIVMGANDGIVSIAGIVIGVASAGSSAQAILISGIAGALAGTISMAVGEYVSVSTQRDAEKQAIIDEKDALKNHYQREFNFIKNEYTSVGVSDELATKATQEMLNGNQLYVAVRERYGFDLNDKTSAVGAAIASMISFPTGALLPLLAVTLLPASLRIIGTVIAVAVALVITGYVASVLGKEENHLKSTVRNVIVGLLTMLVTYVVGLLFDH